MFTVFDTAKCMSGIIRVLIVWSPKCLKRQEVFSARSTIPLEKLDQGPQAHAVSSTQSTLATKCLPTMNHEQNRIVIKKIRLHKNKVITNRNSIAQTNIRLIVCSHEHRAHKRVI
jgi:hypothetical protein